MKIAPTLRCSDAIAAKSHPAMCECVAARVKALESVARAAELANRNAPRSGAFCRYGVDEDRFARALARLDRVSAGKRGGRP